MQRLLSHSQITKFFMCKLSYSTPTLCLFNLPHPMDISSILEGWSVNSMYLMKKSLYLTIHTFGHIGKDYVIDFVRGTCLHQ